MDSDNAGTTSTCQRPGFAPKIAYILLWFPLSSETFIFREVKSLLALGLPIQVYTMYGESLAGCSAEMRAFPGPVRHYGIMVTLSVLAAFFRALMRRPHNVIALLREGFFHKMRDVEALGENLWCFMAGFLLAEHCRDQNITLIHACWANGPATAAWVASHLTGIPFAFTGRAGDVYPEDGLLREKSRDAIFVRTNNLANVRWLRQFCPHDQADKIHLVYNSLTFVGDAQISPREERSDDVFRILAVGRFARTKGFPELFSALARLRRERLPVRLTLVGDGRWRGRLLRQLRRMRLRDIVDMPGFIPHDEILAFMRSHDLLVVPSVVHSNGDRDGIPNVIMEALVCGLPVVATDVNGIPEVIRNNETGLLVPQRNPTAMADALRRMLENRERARSMAEAGKALVKQMFDSKKNITMLRNLYISHCVAGGDA
ncbi:MAG: glycosyltransferase [Desulfovibrio sp.]|jgi:glycosyltransferase involved in cell wall biosynthesis|nr:glycosyltransferase [Desulfovibrio sp.]